MADRCGVTSSARSWRAPWSPWTTSGCPRLPERLRVYAEAASQVARSDSDWVREADDAQKLLVATTSSVLWEAVLASMRRLAVEDQAARGGIGIPSPRVTSGS